MIRYMFILLISISVSGCHWFTRVEEKEVIVTKIERVIVTVDESLLIKPDSIPHIDTQFATQKDVAKWVTRMYEQNLEYDSKFDAILEWNSEHKKGEH